MFTAQRLEHVRVRKFYVYTYVYMFRCRSCNGETNQDVYYNYIYQNTLAISDVTTRLI